MSENLAYSQNSTQVFRSANNLCLLCGAPLRDGDGARRCRPCLERLSSQQKAKRILAKRQGICIFCLKRRARNGFVSCAKCSDTASVIHKRRAKKKRERGVCFVCSEPPLESLVAAGENRLLYCRDCYFKKAANSRLGCQREWKTLKAKFEQQNERCAYTGVRLILGVNDSIDHIKPVSRFPEEATDINNIQWTTREVNMMKRNLTGEEFLAIVKSICFYKQIQPPTP